MESPGLKSAVSKSPASKSLVSKSLVSKSPVAKIRFESWGQMFCLQAAAP
jgi:hypothetical protein